MIERWQWNKDAYTGEAFEIDANGDTLFSERLYLRSFQGVNGYLALLPNQQLTLFSGIKADENIWEFKNEDHDFPSLIQYHLEGDSTITVTLLAKGEPMSGEFSYQLRRVK